MNSTNDDNGFFSFTFTVGDAAYVWGLKSNPTGSTGTIGMTLYGVVEIINPPGWTSSVGPQEWVQWWFTNGIAYLGQPSVTFSIRSSSPVPILYDDSPNFPRGTIVGSVYDINTHEHLGGGFQTFPYIGPAAVPEPSVITQVLVGALLVLWLRKQNGTEARHSRHRQGSF